MTNSQGDVWVRCKNCGHKLFKVVDTKSNACIETKCHSCKAINEINLKGFNLTKEEN